MTRSVHPETKKIGGISFLLLLAIQSLLAQPQSLLKRDLFFDQLPDKFELSQRAINCILQDKEGFLWIGTWSGLIRYDGYSSILYKSETGVDKLKSDLITSLYEDRNGYLWVGTLMEGLFKFDKKSNSFKQYKHDLKNKQSLSSNRVRCVQEDGDGKLWVGTENGLNRWDESADSFTAFQANSIDPNSLSSSRIRALYRSSKNDFWVATEDGINLVRSQGKGHYFFKKFRYTDDHTNIAEHNYTTQIGEIIQNNKSTIWVTSSRGLKKIEDGTITNYMVGESPLNCSDILSMVTVQGSHPFIITGSENGVSFFDVTRGKFVRMASVFDERSNLSHNSATALFIDKGGILWVGTKRGLNKVDSYSNDFQAYKINSFDKTRSVITGVETATDGGYWVSTMGGGLFKITGQHVQKAHIKNAKSERVDFIQTIHVDRVGNVWLGTAGDGVYRFREKDFEKTNGNIVRSDLFATSNTVLSADYISSMAEDNAGNIWIGTWHQGLNRISPDGTVQFFNENTLFEKPLTTMHVDRTGTVWIGTQGAGLYKANFTDRKLNVRRLDQDAKDKGELPNNFINAVLEDHTGLLWLGTNDGLYSLDPRSEVFNRFHWNNDPDNSMSIVGIQEDRNGRFWLAHADGITVVNPNDTTFSKKFDYTDRIQGGFYYNNITSRNSDGELLFGGTEGFNIIKPDSLRENRYVPKVIITDIQIFGQSVTAQQPVLKKGLLYTGEIKFSHDQNSITFMFTMPEYSSPEKTRYSYKLEGFDKSWNFTYPGIHDAIYTNINPGNYIFKVKAFNNDNIGSKEITQVNVVIDPPWWKSIWAGIGYAVLAILALLLVRRGILWRAELMHSIDLNQQEAARLQELDTAKTKFFTNVSHEFRTPITLILSPLERLRLRMKEPEGQKELNLIDRNARRLLNLVNQLLDFRKLEVDEIRFTPSVGDIIKFIEETFEAFSDLSGKKDINLVFRSEVEHLETLFDRDKIEKILFNLLSNALKFTPAKGSVSVEVSMEHLPKEKFLVLKVIDTGIGIPDAIKDKIFERFFQGDVPNSMLNQGSGIGLSLTREFVKIHNGFIFVENTPGVGSAFIVKLPISEAFLKQSEPLELRSHKQHELPEVDMLSDKKDVKLPLLLLVEDNDDFRAYLKDNLKTEYTILEARDGEEGWNKCLVDQPSLVVSDIMMPRMTGLELCNRIKNNSIVSHIPVILLTARTEEEQKLEGLTQGADDYITKPFNFGVLRSRIQYLISLRKQFHQALSSQIPVRASDLKITSLDEKFIKDAIAIVEENISDAGFSIGELCKRMLISRTTLFKKILALTGKSPLDFIKTIRLQQAAQLLERSQLMVSEVAYKVGFNDPKYFARQFKQAYGLLPSEYAAQKRRSERSSFRKDENQNA